MTAKRNKVIDCMKGIGIILMVLGHMHVSEIVDKLIYSFHMPLFFIVSGYLYQKRPIEKAFIVNKAKHLLLPYFFFGGVYTALYLVLNGTQDIAVKVKGLLLVSVYNISYESALWFLIVLFETVVLYRIIDTVIAQIHLRRLCVFSLSMLGMIWRNIIPALLPWGLQVVFVAVGLLEVGRFVRDHSNENFFIESKKICFFTAVIVWTPVVIANGQLNMRTSSYNNFLFSILGALIGTYLIYHISKWLSNSFLVRPLSNISRWAILFLVTNHMVLSCAEKVFCGVSSVSVRFLLEFIAAIVLLYTTSSVLYKTPVKYVLGE